MPFTIPDTDGTVLGDIRAGIYAGSFDALVDGSRRYGVVSGCAVTANGSGLGVNVASGVIENDGAQVTVTPSSPAVTLNTADATLYRIDLIEVNSSGTVGKVSGTAAAAPVAPAGTSGSVRLAYVVVPPTLTTLVTATHVVDQRVSLSAGGSLPARTSTTYTTASLANNANEAGSIALAKAFHLLRIVTDRAARVRLYTTTAQRDADVSRAIGTDPTGNHGVILDFVTTAGVLDWGVSSALGQCLESSPSTAIGINVTNLSGSTHTVAATIYFVKDET